MEKTARFLHMFSSAKAAGLGVFGYDSITVSYAAWELISVSMCYSQGDRFNTSLSNRLCTVPLSYFPALLTYRLACLLCVRSVLVCVLGGEVAGGMVMCYPGRR